MQNIIIVIAEKCQSGGDDKRFGGCTETFIFLKYRQPDFKGRALLNLRAKRVNKDEVKGADT